MRGPALATDVLHCLPIFECGFDCQKISGLAVVGVLLDGSASPCESATACRADGIFRENLRQCVYARSEPIRRELHAWYTGTLYNRLDHPRRDCDSAIPDRVASQSGLRHATYDDRLKWRGTAASRRESLLRGWVSAAPECFLPGPAEPHGGDDQTDH